MNQDPLGKQGTRVSAAQADGQEVWAKQLLGNQLAVILFNRASQPADMSLSFASLPFGSSSDKVNVRDLWRKADLGVFENVFNATQIPSHGVLVLQLKLASADRTS